MIIIEVPYKICKFCGRKFTKEDAIQIKSDQGLNYFGKLNWAAMVFCGWWCSKLYYSRTITRPVLPYNKHHWRKLEHMLEYVMKYADIRVSLSDLCYSV